MRKTPACSWAEETELSEKLRERSEVQDRTMTTDEADPRRGQRDAAVDGRSSNRRRDSLPSKTIGQLRTVLTGRVAVSLNDVFVRIGENYPFWMDK